MSFFSYALKYNVILVVVSKLGNLDGSYDSKAKLPFGLETCRRDIRRAQVESLMSSCSGPSCYYPILKRHAKAPCSKGITKKDTHDLNNQKCKTHTISSTYSFSIPLWCSKKGRKTFSAMRRNSESRGLVFPKQS